MLRSYRLLILAFGLILAGASPPKENGQKPDHGSNSQAEKALSDIASALGEANKPSDLEQPCSAGEDQRSSDLCAQWKAADAAKSSADAAWLFGTLGSLIGTLTLAAAGAAAWYASKAAAAANQALRSERAFLTFKDAVASASSKQQRFSVGMVFENTGSSPAIEPQVAFGFALTDSQCDSNPPDFSQIWPNTENRRKCSHVGPDRIVGDNRKGEILDLIQVFKRQKFLYAYGRVEYGCADHVPHNGRYTTEVVYRLQPKIKLEALLGRDSTDIYGVFEPIYIWGRAD